MQIVLPDASDGIIRFVPSGTRLAPDTTENVFLSTPEGANSIVVVANPPHVTYGLSGQFDLQGIAVGVFVFFSSGAITQASLFVATGARGWSEWSEAEELQHRDLLNHLLTSVYGLTRAFRWGQLEAVYDARSGSAAITIRYASN